MDEKSRSYHLLETWKNSSVKNLEEEQLDFFNREIQRFIGWDRRSRVQEARLNNLLKKFNDWLEEILKKKGLM